MIDIGSTRVSDIETIAAIRARSVDVLYNVLPVSLRLEELEYLEDPLRPPGKENGRDLLLLCGELLDGGDNIIKAPGLSVLDSREDEAKEAPVPELVRRGIVIVVDIIPLFSELARERRGSIRPRSEKSYKSPRYNASNALPRLGL